MRGDRALGILGNAISPNSSAASVDQSKKKITVIESQLSGSLSPAQIYPSYFFALSNAFYLNGVYYNWPRAHNSSQDMCLWWGNPAVDASDGDILTVSFPLAAGDYYLEWCALKDGTSPKVDIYLDDVIVVSLLDLYAAATSYNLISKTACTCTYDGNHTIKIQVNGKNASSSEYRVYATYIQMIPA